jgi:hypothetical protein
MEIRKSQRRQAKARIALIAPSGAGKTLSSLLIAHGLVGDWGKIGFLDTENGSGELYTGFRIGSTTVGEYLYGRIESPFTVPKYLDGIAALEDAGCEAVIIDSLSHAWAGEGGLLDKQGKLADMKGNSYTAWRTVTPEHNRLVERMLQSSAHILACVRAKTEYVQEKDDKGKTTVRKVGMAPVQRDGLEYEFTLVFDLDIHHVASASKDRTGLFDGQLFTPAPATGRTLREWLESAVPAVDASPVLERIHGAGTLEELAKILPEAQAVQDVSAKAQIRAAYATRKSQLKAAA